MAPPPAGWPAAAGESCSACRRPGQQAWRDRSGQQAPPSPRPAARRHRPGLQQHRRSGAVGCSSGARSASSGAWWLTRRCEEAARRPARTRQDTKAVRFLRQWAASSGGGRRPLRDVRRRPTVGGDLCGMGGVVSGSGRRRSAVGGGRCGWGIGGGRRRETKRGKWEGENGREREAGRVWGAGPARSRGEPGRAEERSSIWASLLSQAEGSFLYDFSSAELGWPDLTNNKIEHSARLSWESLGWANLPNTPFCRKSYFCSKCGEYHVLLVLCTCYYLYNAYYCKVQIYEMFGRESHSLISSIILVQKKKVPNYVPGETVPSRTLLKTNKT
jgi:hypothetical protein